MSKITFEQAWAAWEAKGFQYGEDALEQVRFGWEIANSHSNEDALREQIADLESKLATTHLKVTLLQVELDKAEEDARNLTAALMSFAEHEPYDGRAVAERELAEHKQRLENSSIATIIDMASAPPPTPESLELDQVMGEDPQLQGIFEENAKAFKGYVPEEVNVAEENLILAELGLPTSKV